MTPQIQVQAPWTATQVQSLNDYQANGRGHPFTCGKDACRGPDGLAERERLHAAEDGWHCGSCGYTQNWAWTFMTDFSWRQPGPWTLIVFTGVHGNI